MRGLGTSATWVDSEQPHLGRLAQVVECLKEACILLVPWHLYPYSGKDHPCFQVLTEHNGEPPDPEGTGYALESLGLLPVEFTYDGYNWLMNSRPR